MDHRRYYVIGTTSGEHGPYSQEELQEALAEGLIQAHDMVRTGLGTMIGPVSSLLQTANQVTDERVDDSGSRRASRSMRVSTLIMVAVVLVAAGLLYAIRPTLVTPPPTATSRDSTGSPLLPDPPVLPLTSPKPPSGPSAPQTHPATVASAPIQPVAHHTALPFPASCPKPLIELACDVVANGTSPNTGSTATTAPFGTLTPDWPRFCDKGPGISGLHSLDFGAESHPYAVDILKTGKALEALKSFTITAWVNNRDSGDMYGGNRIVCWINHGHGVDLSYKHDGSLQLGINDWADKAAHTSSPGMIPASKEAASALWRFFAVTYDSTLDKRHLCYYFGTADRVASLDRVLDYPAGPTGVNASAGVAIGHVSQEDRQRNSLSMFRGLITQLRIWGSRTDGSGALSLQQVVDMQMMAVPLKPSAAHGAPP